MIQKKFWGIISAQRSKLNPASQYTFRQQDVLDVVKKKRVARAANSRKSVSADSKRSSGSAKRPTSKKTASKTAQRPSRAGANQKSASKGSRSAKAPKGSRPGKRVAKSPAPVDGPQRLNKVLAGAGLGSRREVEELIVQGRVEVANEIVTDLATKVDPATTQIKVDGQRLRAFRPVYFILNKPKGVLSTNKDPSGRMRVIDFVPDNQRVFCVGRLDKSSEGLMLLTNDGALAQKLAHPSFRVQKVYHVVVAGLMTKEELAKLRKGVYLAEGFARIDGAKIKKQRKSSTELEIALSEGKNREIRRILARAGHKVVTLRRIAIGPLRLAQLPVGTARLLTTTEVNQLYNVTEAPRPKRKTSGKKPKSKSTSAAKVTSESQVTPAFEDDFDDDIVQLPFMTDAGSDASDFDDDFVSFTGETAGSVLGYDDPPAAPKKRTARKTNAASRTGKSVAGAKTRDSKPGRSKTSASSSRKSGGSTRKSSSRTERSAKSTRFPSGARSVSGKRGSAKKSGPKRPSSTGAKRGSKAKPVSRTKRPNRKKN